MSGNDKKDCILEAYFPIEKTYLPCKTGFESFCFPQQANVNLYFRFKIFINEVIRDIFTTTLSKTLTTYEISNLEKKIWIYN